MTTDQAEKSPVAFTDNRQMLEEFRPPLSEDPFKGKNILIVEDDEPIRVTIREYLTRVGFNITCAFDGLDGSEKVKEHEFDLIITDLSMPRLDGFGFIKESIKAQSQTPIIILSGQGTFENAIRGIHMGAYDFVAKPIMDFESFKITVNRGLERKSLILMQKRYQYNLEDKIAQQTEELIEKNEMLGDYADKLEDVSVSVIGSLTVALEEKDLYTAGHSNRVTQFCEGIGLRMGIGDDDLWVLTTAAKLHDLGKLMVDISFINKPGPLTPEEWDIMKQHPVIANRILAPLPFLDNVRPLILSHHERLDGSGYPFGISGSDFDMLTQILAAADSLDAMTSKRSYRTMLAMDEALAELLDCSGKLFDDEIIQGLVGYIKQTLQQ